MADMSMELSLPKEINAVELRRAMPEKQRFGRAVPAKKTDTWIGVRCMDCGREKWPLRSDVPDLKAYRCRSCRKKREI